MRTPDLCTGPERWVLARLTRACAPRRATSCSTAMTTPRSCASTARTRRCTGRTLRTRRCSLSSTARSPSLGASRRAGPRAGALPALASAELAS